MKYFVLIILLFNISVNLLSQEMDELSDRTDKSVFYYNKVEYDTNGSLRFIFPTPDTSFFALIDASIGIGYGIIPRYYYIGIAGDIAIGLDWFPEDKENNNIDRGYKQREYDQIGFSFGGRIYNHIRIFDFGIMPFFGCDFLFVIFPMLYVGMEISFKIVGIEYAHYLSLGNDNPIRHQISVKIHLPILTE
ncbi:MAG: hypothetical protein LBC51_02900 [Treponema sp.]|jgi:hypothetical protein|nr:hypothetical protein [Treponema sp.]